MAFRPRGSGRVVPIADALVIPASCDIESLAATPTGATACRGAGSSDRPPRWRPPATWSVAAESEQAVPGCSDARRDLLWDPVERSVFRQHLLDAAAAARDFSRQYIEEPLPDAMRFRVHLNSSYDAHATDEFKLFPEDSSLARALATKDLDADGVVDVLWRDGYVPQWADVRVAGEDGRETIIDIVACGRFTADEQRLYYSNTPVAPFGVKGPWLPLGWVEGQRFSIYYRATCWSAEDLARVGRNAAKVWSLALHGPDFTDATLAGAAPFPHLEILELYGVHVTGEGLTFLGRLPKLRIVRARFGEIDEVDLSPIPLLETLTTLSLTFLPPRLAHAARLSEALPNLRELTLGSTCRTESAERIDIRALDQLTLEMPALPSWVATPEKLRWLTLHVAETTDPEVRAVLSVCREAIENLGLRRTPVSDAILVDLEKMPALKYLDAVDTQITEDALEAFAATRPGFRCSPRLARDPVPTIAMEKGTGSILEADVEALVNPVNCVGVMGKGLALAFKEAFPEVFREYVPACEDGKLVLGRVQVVARKAAHGPKFVINFPTKNHWREKSRLEDIKAGLVDLASHLQNGKIASVAIPALGCGLGGLDWKVVRELIVATLVAHLNVKHDMRIVIFAPQ